MAAEEALARAGRRDVQVALAGARRDRLDRRCARPARPPGRPDGQLRLF